MLFLELHAQKVCHLFVPVLFQDIPSRLLLYTFESKSSSRIIKSDQYAYVHTEFEVMKLNNLNNQERNDFDYTERTILLKYLKI